MLYIILRETLSHPARNLVFGVILLVTLSAQMWSILSAGASEAAVRNYGATVFGHEQTHKAYLPDIDNTTSLITANRDIARMQENYPWLKASVSADASLKMTNFAGSTARDKETETRIVGPGWRDISASLDDAPEWDTLTSDDRFGTTVLLGSAIVNSEVPFPKRIRLSVPRDASSSGTVTPPNDGEGSPSGTAQTRDVVALGSWTERNRELASNVLLSPRQAQELGISTVRTHIYFRCSTAQQCADVRGLLSRQFNRVEGIYRVDRMGEILPLLDNNRRNGATFALVVLALGLASVIVVGVAAIELRESELSVMRALGASRLKVAAIALGENLVVAAIVGVITAGLAYAAIRLDPNAFNTIPDVTLDTLSVDPWAFVKLSLITLGTGLATGILPAIKAYRAVRS